MTNLDGNQKEIICDFYKSHGFQKTCKTYNITKSQLVELLLERGVSIRSRSEAYKLRGSNYSAYMFDSLKEKLDKDTLKYMHQHYDIHYICKEFNTSEESVYKLMEEYDIKKLTQKERKLLNLKEKISKEMLIDTYSQYKNLRDTASHLGIGTSSLKNLMLDYNIDRLIHIGSRNLDISKDTLLDMYIDKRLPLTYICKELHISISSLKNLLSLYNLSRSSSIYPSNNNSGPNLFFESKLKEAGIVDYQKEYRIYLKDLKNNYRYFQYDFKVKNILIEINPSVTHNSTRGIRGGQAPVNDIFYHKKKSICAFKNNFICIHIWDWTDIDLVIKNIKESKYNLDVSFENPRLFIYDLDKRELTKKRNKTTVDIYDDGIIFKE